MTRARTNALIFWISLLGLYVELLFIRWIGTEIRIFAYLQNTVLVVCFLGLGIGLFTARRPISVHRSLFALLVLSAIQVIPQSRELLSHVSMLLSVLGEINIWVPGSADTPLTAIAGLLVGLGITFGIMVLVLEPFIPIGRLLGRLLEEHPKPLIAYSVNVAGSLAGIWLFVGLSRLSQPPAVWFAVLTALALPLLLARRPFDWSTILLGGCVVLLVAGAQWSSPAIETVWSPYQKLELLEPEQPEAGGLGTTKYVVKVNNTGFQALADLAPSRRRSRGTGGNDSRLSLSHYDVPALIHPDPQNVLVVGSGAGNDVAGLLRSGVSQITAVEIDPAIVSFGRRYHPERPYASERVRTFTTDARSFFARTGERYDVISFGFLDSHTTTSLTNARLDHYVYTEESFERVRGLLNEGGIVCIAFEPPRPFIADRLAVQLERVFGQKPLTFAFPNDDHGSYGVFFIAGDLDTAGERIASMPELDRLEYLAAASPLELPYVAPPATDDWPYLYLDHPRIPLLFVLLAGLLALLMLYASRTLDLPKTMDPRTWRRESWHFFALGAAFLLLEVQNISKASVALGNTWLVNAVIITGVLVMVLAANTIVIRWPRIPLEPVYGVLLATVLGLYVLDLARFAFLPFAWKALLVGALTTLPMLFSGIAFARAFAVAGRKDYALGANLMGALVGAVLESMSFLLGIKALLLAVAIFYLAAAATRPGVARLSAVATEPATD